MSLVGTRQVVTMEKLLLRRSTTPLGDVQLDAEAFRNSSIPAIDQDSTVLLNTTSHKRKQSDALVLDINHLDLRAKSKYSSLSPIEQGTAGDLEDDNACYAGSSSHGWKNPLCALMSHCHLIALFLLVSAMTTLYAVRSRSSPSEKIEDVSNTNIIFGYDEVGEPLEAETPNEEWIELYASPQRMPRVESAGPWQANRDIGGLHVFENVCVTNNVDAPKPPELDMSSRGLIYFTKDRVMAKNPKRCIPCSKKAMNDRLQDRWNAISDSDSDLGHHCGMKGLHAMFVKSIGDYNHCMDDAENHKLMIRARQNQSPSHVQQIHFFQEPTFLLQFDAHSRENSLFDNLMTYLPHWKKFKSDGYPFHSAISHSVEGCLTHSRNWFCEVLHQAQAFGYANELPWERKESTLYCFKTLYYNQLGYQRDLKHEGLITKAIMDEFRDELFKNLALPGPRDMSEVRKKDAKIGLKRPLSIALYANGQNEWKGLNELVSSAQTMTKYHAVEFNLLEDHFDNLTLAEQATVMNLADAVVMASGDHMANVIFSPDDTFFAELGCSSESLISNEHFMALLLGTHHSFPKCSEDHSDDEICVLCADDGSFTVSGEAFYALLDHIMKRHEEKISFQRDSL